MGRAGAVVGGISADGGRRWWLVDGLCLAYVWRRDREGQGERRWAKGAALGQH